MGKGRICIWIIRPVVTAPAFLPLQRCPGDQSADLCQIFQLYQFSQTPSRSAAGDLRLQICQLSPVWLRIIIRALSERSCRVSSRSLHSRLVPEVSCSSRRAISLADASPVG